MSNTFTLTVKIDPEQVTLLKEAGYSLCISKKVNGVYCVVWQGMSFSVTNTIRWIESYQTFASVSFTDGALVTAETNAVAIAFGQTATISPAGVMGNATGARTGGSFTVENEWQPCNIGVNQQINGLFRPTFVNPLKTILGQEVLTPIVSVMVFFDRTLETGTMFTRAKSSTCEVNYIGDPNETVSYVDAGDDRGNGIWVTGTPATGFNAVVPRSYSIEKGFAALPAADDALAIAEIIKKFKFDDGSSGAGNTLHPCPVIASMTFRDEKDAESMHTIITYRNRDGWPTNWPAMTVNPASPTGTTLSVSLNTIPVGGDSAPVTERWDDFCRGFGTHGPNFPIRYV